MLRMSTNALTTNVPEIHVAGWVHRLKPNPPPSHVSDPRTHVSSSTGASGLMIMPSSASINVFNTAPGPPRARSVSPPLDSQNQSQIDPLLRYEGVPTAEQIRKLRGEMHAMGNNVYTMGHDIAELKRAFEGQSTGSVIARKRLKRHRLAGPTELLDGDQMNAREDLVVSIFLTVYRCHIKWKRQPYTGIFEERNTD